MSRYEIKEPEFTLEDADQISGQEYWKIILYASLANDGLDKLMMFDKKNGLCLTGPAGTGKHTLASAFAGTAISQGWKAYRADGSTLRSRAGDSLEKHIHEIFLEAMGQPSVLIFEKIDREIWEISIREYEAFLKTLPFVFLVTEEDPKVPDDSWRRVLMFCPVSLPSKQDREAFFALKKNGILRKADEQGRRIPGYDWQAEVTEGLDYDQLADAVRQTRLMMKFHGLKGFGGDRARVIEGYRNDEFGLTEDIFLRAVEQVRLQKVQKQPEIPQVQVVLNGQPGIPWTGDGTGSSGQQAIGSGDEGSTGGVFTREDAENEVHRRLAEAIPALRK